MCNLSGVSRFQLFEAGSQVNGTFLLGIVEFMSLKIKNKKQIEINIQK